MQARSHVTRSLQDRQPRPMIQILVASQVRFFLNLTSLDDFQRFLENLKALAILKICSRTYQRGGMVVSKKTLTGIQKL